MGKIIRNGVEYSGACEDATAVNYDNSLSGLNAQTVQEGLDELSSSLEDIVTISSKVSSTSFTLNCTSLNSLKNKYKFISLELMINDGNTYYTQAQTQLPLSAFLIDDKRVLRVSYNNGTYYWVGIRKASDASLTVSAVDHVVKGDYIINVRFYN